MQLTRFSTSRISEDQTNRPCPPLSTAASDMANIREEVRPRTGTRSTGAAAKEEQEGLDEFVRQLLALEKANRARLRVDAGLDAARNPSKDSYGPGHWPSGEEETQLSDTSFWVCKCNIRQQVPNDLTCDDCKSFAPTSRRKEDRKEEIHRHDPPNSSSRVAAKRSSKTHKSAPRTRTQLARLGTLIWGLLATIDLTKVNDNAMTMDFFGSRLAYKPLCAYLSPEEQNNAVALCFYVGAGLFHVFQGHRHWPLLGIVAIVTSAIIGFFGNGGFDAFLHGLIISGFLSLFFAQMLTWTSEYQESRLPWQVKRSAKKVPLLPLQDEKVRLGHI